MFKKIKSLVAFTMVGVLILGQSLFAFAQGELDNLAPYQENQKDIMHFIFKIFFQVSVI